MNYKVDITCDIETLITVKKNYLVDTLFTSNSDSLFEELSSIGVANTESLLSVEELDDLFQNYLDDNDKMLASLREYDLDALLAPEEIDFEEDITFDEDASEERKSSQGFAFDNLEDILRAKQLEKEQKEREEHNERLKQEYLTKQEELLKEKEREEEELKQRQLELIKEKERKAAEIEQQKLKLADDIANVQFEAEEEAARLREDAANKAEQLSKQIKENALQSAANIMQNAEQEALRLAEEAKIEAVRLSELRIIEENNKAEALRKQKELEERRINMDRELEEEKLRLQEQVLNQQKENELQLVRSQQQNQLMAMQKAHESELARINARILTSDEIMPADFPLHIPDLSDVKLPTMNTNRELCVGKRRALSSANYTIYAIASTVSNAFGSTLAYNMARSLASIHKCPVLLVDMDIERADLTFKFKLDQSLNKVFSLPLHDYMNTFDDNISRISIGGVGVRALGFKPYSSLNEIYKKFLLEYDYQKLLHVFGREYNYIVLDLGSLEHVQPYQYTLLETNLTRGILCINAKDKPSLATSLSIANYFRPNQKVVITNYPKNFNIERVSMKLCKPLAGVIPFVEAPSVPIYDNIQHENVCGNFNRIVNNMR